MSTALSHFKYLISASFVVVVAIALFGLPSRTEAATIHEILCGPSGGTVRQVGLGTTCVDAGGAPIPGPNGTPKFFTGAELAAASQQAGQTTSQAVTPTLTKVGAGPDSCWSTNGSWGDYFTCLWRSFMAFFGSIPASIGIWLVTVSGLLFNWLIENTVIQFAVIYQSIETAINTAWTVFRDLANILIIGIFVFIAISIILGLKEFGQKKMVARVLVIAVLINFSLLFTKVIIDASNFAAMQFYKAANLPQDSSPQQVSLLQQRTANAGIAGKYIDFMGITSIGDTYNAVFQVAQNQNSAWIAVLYGLFVGLLLIAVSLVFLYGSFLLVARAILIIFLLMTSALAFASFLIPKLSDGNFGWKAWWSSLLRTAIFAPLLMLLLWATLTIAQSFKATGGTLGSLVTDPRSSLNINALFSYFIVLGLLFASIRIASSFSGTIGGFNWASTIAAAPFTLGTKYLLGPLTRWGYGGGAQARALALGKDVEAEAQKQASLTDPAKRDYRRLSQLLKQQGKEEARAKSSYNLFNKEGAKSLMSGLGVKTFATGADKKPTGYADGAKAKAEEIAKKAVNTALSEEQSYAAAKKEKMDDKEFKERMSAAQASKKAAEETMRAAKSSVETRKDEMKTLKTQLESIHKETAKTLEETGKEKARIDKAHRDGDITDADRDAAMRAEDSKIAKVNEKMQLVKGSIAAINKPVEDAEATARQAAEEYTKLDKEINERAKEIRGASKDVAQEVAKTLAGPLNSTVAQMARSLTKKKVGLSGAAARRKQELEELKGAGLVDEDDK